MCCTRYVYFIIFSNVPTDHEHDYFKSQDEKALMVL